MADTKQNKAEQADNVGTLRKKQLRDYGIFIAILIVIFGILVLFTVSSRKAWSQGLKQSIEQVFEDEKVTGYTVGNQVMLHSSFSTSCGVYHLYKNGTTDNGKQFAVIIKMTTMYGPVAAVYTYDLNGSAQFVGFVCLEGQVAKQLEDISKSTQIAYWANRIPEIVKNAAGDSKAGVGK